MDVRSAARTAAATLWRFRNSRTGFAVMWLLVLVFLGKAALDGYADYQELSPTIRPLPVLAVVALLGIRGVVVPAKWWYILHRAGEGIGFPAAARMFWVSSLASYVPGGVWQYADFGYRARQQGERLEDAATTAVLVQGSSVAASLFIGAAVGAALLPRLRPVLAAAAAAVVAGVAAAPRLLAWLAGQGERFNIDVSVEPVLPRQMFGLFALSVAASVVSGAVLYGVVAALHPVRLSLLLPVVGISAVAWAAGFLVLVLPGGLGVREGVMVWLLQFLIPQPVALAAAVLVRLVLMAGQALAAAFCIFYCRGGT